MILTILHHCLGTSKPQKTTHSDDKREQNVSKEDYIQFQIPFRES